MSIRNMGGRVVTVKRRAAEVLTAVTAAASMDPDAQPSIASIIEVAVSGGTDNTGTVTVSGTVDGSPDTEVLTFSGPGVGTVTKLTTKRFSALDITGGFTSSGLAGETTVSTVQADAVGADGSRNHGLSTIATGIRGHLDRGTAEWRGRESGTHEEEPTWFYLDVTSLWTPRAGDVIVDESSGEQWEVSGPTDYMGGLRAHHHELRVRRRERGA